MELLVPGIGLVFWTLVVVLAIMLLLRKYAWIPILQSLKEREAGIASAKATAERLKAEMATLKKEKEALLASAHHEREMMIKEAKEESFKIIHNAKEKAVREYNQQVSKAFLEIHSQKNIAFEEAKKQVDAIAIEVSEKILRRKLSCKEDIKSNVNW